MSMYDRARKDNAKILGNPNGFSVPMVFTSPTSVQYPVNGFYADTNLDVNANTGLVVIARRVSISVNVYAEDGTTLQFPTENPADTKGDWKVQFTNNVGQNKTYKVIKPIFDRTFGMITMNASEYRSTTIPAPEGD